MTAAGPAATPGAAGTPLIKFSSKFLMSVHLLDELENANVEITSKKPDYVVVAETKEYDYSKITEATLLIQEGAKFIATNKDLTGPSQRGPVPACGTLVCSYRKGYRNCPIFPWKAKSGHDVLGSEEIRGPFGKLFYDW